MTMLNGDGRKSLNLDALRRSAIIPPDNVAPGSGWVYLNVMASAAGDIEPWGRNPTLRDRQLRLFYPTESMIMSAIGTVIARNMAFTWALDSDSDNLAQASQDMLINANPVSGGGWMSWVGMTATDLYTQDKGAFTELIRTGDRETDPVVGIQHLDAARCLGRDTRVWMADGRKVPVIEVVRSRDPGPVLSLSPDGAYEAKPITGWYESGLGARYWLRLRLRHARRAYGREEGMWLTNDHEVLTPDGYARADSLGVGSLVLTADKSPNDTQMELLVGTLLGDSSLSRGRKTTDRVSVAMGHAPQQEEWLRVKMQALEGMNWGPVRGRRLRQVASAATPALNGLCAAFYPERGKKIVPREIVERYFSPRLLAAWFADDGTRQHARWGRDRVRFYTYGFSADDSDWLAGLLTRHGYDAHTFVRRVRTGPYAGLEHTGIYVGSEGAARLFSDIAPYLPDCMRHKLPDAAAAYDPSLWSIGEAEPWAAAVESIERGGNGGQAAAYCIDVQDNHNFVAANTVVHNCWHTGVPETPVLYVDRRGKWHAMKWFEVSTLREMPAPHEMLHGLQYCALSRVLTAAQIFHSLEIYQGEKLSGRNPRAIHIVGGISREELQGAVSDLTAAADARGLLRYVNPYIYAALDPSTKPEVATLELASMPDGFNAGELFKQYLTQIAMGLLADYQDFAPLPGGGLGTASQSEVLREKARGKGAGVWMRLIEHLMNFGGVLPQGVSFRFDEQDLSADRETAEIKKLRAEARGQMITNGEIDAAGARQLALDEGDMSQELFELMDAADIDLTGPTVPDPYTVVDENGDLTSSKAYDPKRAGPDQERLDMEREAAEIIAGGLDSLRRGVRRRLSVSDSENDNVAMKDVEREVTMLLSRPSSEAYDMEFVRDERGLLKAARRVPRGQ